MNLLRNVLSLSSGTLSFKIIIKSVKKKSWKREGKNPPFVCF
jgi:hypothetical protein